VADDADSLDDTYTDWLKNASNHLQSLEKDGYEVVKVPTGDVVWFPPGEKHWHGASPTTAVTHLAIQEALDGKAVEWLEHVSDEQYQAKRSSE
jgi:oxalate decarboxylase/phosphoglucose isomerase-like protein (cupin superfamily)